MTIFDCNELGVLRGIGPMHRGPKDRLKTCIALFFCSTSIARKAIGASSRPLHTENM